MKKTNVLVNQAPVSSSEMSSLAFYQKCQSYIKYKNYNAAIKEEFPAWAFEQFVTKGRSRVDLLFIDFLRLEFGATGSAKQKAGKASMALEDYHSFSSGFSEMLECKELISSLSCEEKEMLTSYFYEGKTLEEIAVKKSLTKARIKQRLDEITEKLFLVC